MSTLHLHLHLHGHRDRRGGAERGLGLHPGRSGWKEKVKGLEGVKMYSPLGSVQSLFFEIINMSIDLM